MGMEPPEIDIVATARARARGAEAVDLIVAERVRQITAEGWSREHDDGHVGGELAMAACCYATHAGAGDMDPGYVPSLWPFESAAWKPTGDRVRDLVKAGALLAAEIDRLERQS